MGTECQRDLKRGGGEEPSGISHVPGVYVFVFCLTSFGNVPIIRKKIKVCV